MNFAGMNILAIGLAAVAGFAFGAVYYMSLSRQWLAAIGKTKEEISGKRSIAPFITSFVALVVMAWVLAGTLGHLGPGQVTLKNGVISALFVWVGFVATGFGDRVGQTLHGGIQRRELELPGKLVVTLVGVDQLLQRFLAGDAVLLCEF